MDKVNCNIFSIYAEDTDISSKNWEISSFYLQEKYLNPSPVYHTKAHQKLDHIFKLQVFLFYKQLLNLLYPKPSQFLQFLPILQIYPVQD